MKKIFLSLLVSLFFISSTLADEISAHINRTNFGFKSKVSVYVLNADKNKVIYKKNENDFLNPASILKPLTFGVIYQVLGSDYQFETSLFQDEQNNIYLKLGGDVLLTQKDLNNLISNIKNKEIGNIYIDDSIFDKTPYPSTWLDEDKWPNQGMITPYIIDNNTVQIAINRSSLAKKVDIIQNDEYKIPFINELKIGEKQDIKIARLYGENSPIINLQGYVSEDEIINLPVLNPEVNFNIKLNKALEKNKIVYLNKIEIKKTPENAKKIAYVSHSINDISKLILHQSNNFAAEVAFLSTASNYYKKSANLDDAIKMFNEIYAPFLSQEDKIADGSGVSRQNFLSTKTIANITAKLLKNEEFKNLMPTSNDGTMAERLLFLKDNLKAKTGTMRELSSFCANFKTRNNTNVILVSIIQDSKLRKSLMKNFENTLVGIIYKKY